MTIIEIIVTIFLGTAAGFINTFAGGGSMLVVPFLIFIGLPANVANATNRIAILLQNVVSVSGFKQKKYLISKPILNCYSPWPSEVSWVHLLPWTSTKRYSKKS